MCRLRNIHIVKSLPSYSRAKNIIFALDLIAFCCHVLWSTCAESRLRTSDQRGFETTKIAVMYETLISLETVNFKLRRNSNSSCLPPQQKPGDRSEVDEGIRGQRENVLKPPRSHVHTLTRRLTKCGAYHLLLRWN